MNDIENKVNKGFSAIYQEYEELSQGINKTVWQRKMVYQHVEKYVSKFHTMLEINAGSGIDASYFARKGKHVLATDLTDGSEKFFTHKLSQFNFNGRLSFRKLSYSQLDQLKPQKFEYVLSNFGGLNCVERPDIVLQSLVDLLEPKAKITVVIMPKHYPREWLSFFKNRKKSTRRYKQGPILANVEGEQIKVWYHSLSQLKKDLKDSYNFVKAENLGVLLPENDNFGLNHPIAFKALLGFNNFFRKIVPAGIGDYYVATFQKKN